MRELLGLFVAHAVLVAAGLGALRALRLTGPGWRSGLLALGPGLLLGVTLVVPSPIALLVVGVPLTLWTAAAVGGVWALAGFKICRRGEKADTADTVDTALTADAHVMPGGRVRLLVLGFFGVYAAFGAYALARLPTVSDDARIWSLKGLTLTYYDTLRPEMFDSPFVVRAHPVYPLLQPVLRPCCLESRAAPVPHRALAWCAEPRSGRQPICSPARHSLHKP